jgi:N-acetylmuramoyl-L-alanine amidase
MKRYLILALATLLAASSILLAQQSGQATLRTPSGDKPLPTIHQNAMTFFSAPDVITALGGTVTPDSNGFKVTLNNVAAAFGPDSRFAVVRDDLIEMPLPPVTIDGKPYVSAQFFAGFLSRAADLEVSWDANTRVLTVKPQQHTIAGVQVSVANVQGTTKVVIVLTAPVDYSIVKEQQAYTIRFKNAIRAPYTDQTHEDPNVSHTTFSGNDLRIQLTAPDVVGDAYRLENPFRVVLDLRKAAAPAPGTPPPAITRPVESPGIHTIVIDPGHGGKDVGALGPGGTMEKDATLALCRKLAASLGAKTGARVVLTREDDSLVSLDQRTGIANQYKADLFLSVHMNAAVVKGAKGSETYFLSMEASDELARKAAETENAAAKTANAATSSDLKLILWDLAQQEYVKESERLATDVQEEMNSISGIQNRGVKQAPFKVLVGATMPAALVEVAFISNPDEEAKLKDDAFVTTVVDALTRAVVRYKTDYETRIGVIRPPAPAPATTRPAAPAPATTTTK